MALLAVVTVGIGAAHGAGPDLSAFIGTWTMQAGTTVTIDCTNPLPPVSLTGTPISIYPGKTSDLTFDMGCGCTIDLSVDASGTHASRVSPQTCSVYPKGYTLSGMVQSLDIDLAASPPRISLQGDGAQLTFGTFSCSAATFDGAGTLARTSAEVFDCGRDDDAVGVVAVSASGADDCPLGAGRELVRITMHDEDSLDPKDSKTKECSHTTGALGEGSWVLPDDNRPRALVCGKSNLTTLNICRIDGARFKPLTTVESRAQFYAVLKLGNACPNGGIEVSKTIDNEDQPGTMLSTLIGRAGPNVVASNPPVVTRTTLFFCYYRTAPAPDGVMPAFPDLGLPYAVFHSFKGEQPPWVIAKRWQYSNDEDDQNGDPPYESADSAIAKEFQDVIENPDRTNTYFNYARVR